MAALTTALAVPLGATTTQYIVVDRHSGIALSGYDPVAYFTDGEALLGRATFELAYAGTVWRFRNEGNRAAFEADPDIYMPRFGGYDPVGIARGVGVPGHPHLWLIAGERLYFFYSGEARDAFRADPDEVTENADKMWPAVQRTLSP
jgi:YHS domain-containing protein